MQTLREVREKLDRELAARAAVPTGEFDAGYCEDGSVIFYLDLSDGDILTGIWEAPPRDLDSHDLIAALLALGGSWARPILRVVN